MKMRIKFINALIAAVVLLFPLTMSLAQQVEREPYFSLGTRLRNGIYVAFSTRTDPSGPRHVSVNSIEADTKGIIHRVLVDQEGNHFFGYDLRVEPVPHSKQFQIFISPLSEEFEQRLRRRESFQTRKVHPDFNALPLAEYQYSQIINDGDAFAYDVLVNRSTGVKIVDIIKISSRDISLGGPPAIDFPARDFALRDVELKMNNYRLLINGELIYGDKPTGGCSGSIIWFYLPDRGRFIFSITPHEEYGFQKVGLIENNKISFSFNGEHYEWISSSPVVASGGRWNLYVLHDGDYRPELDASPAIRRMWERWERARIERQSASGKAEDSLNTAPQTIGAADSIELLLSKKND